jgi:hypothetical protein
MTQSRHQGDRYAMELNRIVAQLAHHQCPYCSKAADTTLADSAAGGVSGSAERQGEYGEMKTNPDDVQSTHGKKTISTQRQRNRAVSTG